MSDAARAAAAATDATARLAAWSSALDGAALPAAVRDEARRCLVNFVGCVLGGRTHPVVEALERGLGPWAGAGRASLIGAGRRADPGFAALVNGAAASAHSFDDTHAEAIVHPGAPVCAAALALAQDRGASGAALLTAIVAGVEATCRVSKAISVPPATIEIGWYQTGICGGVGAALAAARLMNLDAATTRTAITLAVAQASGTRILQGSATMLMLAGHAAQSGLRAAAMAAGGVGGPGDALEGRHGLLDAYAHTPHAAALVDGLGDAADARFEILANVYKPYPCGVVLQPVIDACLAWRARHGADVAAIDRIVARVPPVTLTLADRRHPADPTAAQVSVHHWIAVALARGRAGLDELAPAAIADPAIRALRDRVEPVADPALPRSAAEIVVHRAGAEPSGAAADRAHAPPMSEAALDAKFRAQAALRLAPARIDALAAALATIGDRGNVETLGDLLD